jgi:hypothetical protein
MQLVNVGFDPLHVLRGAGVTASLVYDFDLDRSERIPELSQVMFAYYPCLSFGHSPVCDPAAQRNQPL